MTRTQTTWYSKLNDPNIQGGRLKFQFGTCKFAARKKTVTLTTELKSVIGFSYAYKYGRPSCNAATVSTACSLGTTGTVLSGGFIRVSRATGGAKGAKGSAWASAATFWYELVGW